MVSKCHHDWPILYFSLFARSFCSFNSKLSIFSYNMIDFQKLKNLREKNLNLWVVLKIYFFLEHFFICIGWNLQLLTWQRYLMKKITWKMVYLFLLTLSYRSLLVFLFYTITPKYFANKLLHNRWAKRCKKPGIPRRNIVV